MFYYMQKFINRIFQHAFFGFNYHQQVWKRGHRYDDDWSFRELFWKISIEIKKHLFFDEIYFCFARDEQWNIFEKVRWFKIKGRSLGFGVIVKDKEDSVILLQSALISFKNSVHWIEVNHL